jgi:hypothetical protein
MNKYLLLKSVASLSIVIVIIIGSVIAIRSIVKATKQRCDVGLVWSIPYGKCIEDCDKINAKTDPTSGKCNCVPGYEWNSDKSECVPTCHDDETRCGLQCTKGCCTDGEQVCEGRNTCYQDVNSVIQCCKSDLKYPTPCTSSGTTGCWGCGPKPSPPGSSCATGTYNQSCGQGNTKCCQTGATCSQCGNGELKCCQSGSGCTASTDNQSTNCCPDGQTLSNDGKTCCDSNMLSADGMCCLEICSLDPANPSARQCCDATGYMCNPDTNICQYVCGYGSNKTTPNNPMSSGPTDTNTIPVFCSSSDACYTDKEPGKAWITTCNDASPACQFGSDSTFPNINGNTKNDLVYCNGPMGADDTECPKHEHMIFCATGNTDTKNLRRRGTAVTSQGKTCSYADCISLATSRDTFTDYLSWDGATCQWGEKPNETFPSCGSSSTCPKAIGANMPYCCDYSIGEIQPTAYSSTCPTCAKYDMVNTSIPAQLTGCTACNPPYGKEVDNACVCSLTATGESVGGHVGGDDVDSTFRGVTVLMSGLSCSDPIPCENRTDMQVTHRGMVGSNPCTTLSMGCKTAACTYGRSYGSPGTTVGATGHCFAPASCGKPGDGSCEETQSNSNDCHYCADYNNGNPINPCTHVAGGDKMITCIKHPGTHLPWHETNDSYDCQY